MYMSESTSSHTVAPVLFLLPGHVAVKFLNGEPTAGGWTVVVGFVLAGMGGYEFYKRNKKLSVVHAFEEENNVTDEKRKYTLDEAIIRSRDLCQRIKV